MTCSWGERRSYLGLRESMMLSCWPTGPSITRLVRASVEMCNVCRPLLVNTEKCLRFMFCKCVFVFFPYNWTINSTDLEKIKSYIDSFRYGAPPHGGGGIGKGYLRTDIFSLTDQGEMFKAIFICWYVQDYAVWEYFWTVMFARPGESLHAVPWSPQRTSDLHVPTWS